MSFGAFDQHRSPAIAEINMTPLVDVLLVLLVIFLVTLPLTSSMIPVNLPRVAAESGSATAQAFEVTVNQQGQLFLGDRLVSLSEIEQQFSMADAQKRPLKLRVDSRAEFNQVAQLLGLANRYHITQVGFVTLIPRKPSA